MTQAADSLFHELLHAFGRCTSVPILLNTSFDDCDEPLVCSPQDAVRTFRKTDLDALVMGSFFVQKSPQACG